MDKKIAGLLGAAVALGTLGAVQAAPAPAATDVLTANSFADLLEPIPNAVALLQAMDESPPAASADGNIQVAQYYYHHHHHHHHHGWRRIVPRIVPRYYHHHHHHHYHHHHHHHHHGYYR
ncbi:MAG: hypothetical protein KGK01_05575 [Bradyrhizobium sp.]|uniref:hypothetical protein n=1 Tax=Bradyrhizobium sp. TaxID=376 RepID=UPI001C29CBE8|nr:hypothetical protein [Bradyrhizobium sp.]MBU6462097.1 hypothetical protein [Pseudomonadota bacterium]MDE2066828.1 hypothetical protein [Bradyrhizobium sp.]MDE2241921.1 hypothetical protein [Bradyrhizobium sp.]MDE2468110.1 hypothetical protein [Bradyrhizobium sp.]